MQKDIPDDIIVHVSPKENLIGLDSFDGYSPNEMVFILYQLFGDNSSVKFQKLTEAEYKKIPLLNQIKYIIELITEKGRLKLTAKGFFSKKIVTDIYQQGFLKDYLIEKGYKKRRLEKDIPVINLARNLLEMSGIAKKRHGYLSLTKKGEKTVPDNFALLTAILKTFFTKFNWGYYDRYDNDEAGRLGIGFTLILLSKYGNKKRSPVFYADKYYKAFPFLIDKFMYTTYSTPEKSASRCYSLRSFEKYLNYLGLITLEGVHGLFDEIQYMKKTKLFDKLIKIKPYNDQNFKIGKS